MSFIKYIFAFSRQLHLAILNEYIEASKRLIDICPNTKLLDIRNDNGHVSI